jgi:hypothetical protein
MTWTKSQKTPFGHGYNASFAYWSNNTIRVILDAVDHIYRTHDALDFNIKTFEFEVLISDPRADRYSKPSPSVSVWI